MAKFAAGAAILAAALMALPAAAADVSVHRSGARGYVSRDTIPTYTAGIKGPLQQAGEGDNAHAAAAAIMEMVDLRNGSYDPAYWQCFHDTFGYRAYAIGVYAAEHGYLGYRPARNCVPSR